MQEFNVRVIFSRVEWISLLLFRKTSDPFKFIKWYLQLLVQRFRQKQRRTYVDSELNSHYDISPQLHQWRNSPIMPHANHEIWVSRQKKYISVRLQFHDIVLRHASIRSDVNTTHAIFSTSANRKWSTLVAASLTTARLTIFLFLSQ